MRTWFTRNSLLVLMALVAFGFCFYFGVVENYHAMWISFLAFLGLLFFLNLDRIVRFKIDKSGIEAETRAVVDEAKSTIKELQDLSKIMAESMLGLLKRSGRWGGYSYNEKEQLKDQTLEVLKQIGVSDEEIDDIIARCKWHNYVGVDYVAHITGGSHLPKKLPRDRIGDWEKLRHHDIDNVASPDEIREFLKSCQLLTPEIEELIKDYQYYVDHRKQRRPKVWSDRNNWSKLLN